MKTKEEILKEIERCQSDINKIESYDFDDLSWDEIENFNSEVNDISQYMSALEWVLRDIITDEKYIRQVVVDILKNNHEDIKLYQSGKKVKKFALRSKIRNVLINDSNEVEDDILMKILDAELLNYIVDHFEEFGN
jgi:hypothetical protein